MNKLHYWSTLFLAVFCVTIVNARNLHPVKKTKATTKKNKYRNDCTASRSETDLNINNVRAHLRTGGDMWWDLNRGLYIVPNVLPGEEEVSSLFSGGIWLGAYDDGGNLIMAAKQYNNGNDYWTGPLNPDLGTTEASECERWDIHFEVSGADIRALRADFLDPNSPGVDLEPSKGLKGWPARGNKDFKTVHGFDILDYNQDLAPFIDVNGDNIYNPYDGDHPVIEVTGCSKTDYEKAVFADQMIWWVYNDNGNLHTQSNGNAMKMEIQALAFSYATTDAINNMTFYRYKLLNRNKLALNDTYFSLWTDPDLGCYDDDFIGCDSISGMGYVYNKDANDDNPCGANGGSGYGTSVPALGVDYFRGPLDSAGNQIGLSSFQYSVGQGAPQGTGQPTGALQFYRLISGFWSDGTPITNGGTGYNPGSTTKTNFVFHDWPNDQNGWSMCHADGPNQQLGQFDPRFNHVSGPFVLLPGATNEMISGVVWVPEIPDYPCPSLSGLVEADQLAQNLFDDCFKLIEGPQTPYMDIVEMDNKLILNLSYINTSLPFSYEESPGELRPFAPLDTTYNFQGYKIYQVKSPSVSVTDLDDETQARLIFQSDVKDNISKIANWETFSDPDLNINVPSPKIMVEGENKGIQHTFEVTTDIFASGNTKLVNHKPYYFCVVAYAHNEYQQFDPIAQTGQSTPYIQGRLNFNINTGIPRKNEAEYSGVEIVAAYGDQPEITRLEGKGAGAQEFLELADIASFETEMFTTNRVGKVVYKSGSGPVKVKVVDPLRIAKGNFNLYIYDDSYTWDTTTAGAITPNPQGTPASLSNEVKWVLVDADNPTEWWTASQPMDVTYEHYIPELGISMSLNQVTAPGRSNGVERESGALGSSVTYSDSITHGKWFGGLSDGSVVYNYLKTGAGEDDELIDKDNDYSSYVGGWHPFMLADATIRTDVAAGAELFISTGVIKDLVFDDFGANLRNKLVADGKLTAREFRDTMLSTLPNVNIVLTADESKWSRCIVVESASFFYSDASNGLGLSVPSGLKQMQWRGSDKAAKNYYSRNLDMTEDQSSKGMSWFPGYAYNVGTGERLNVFFGENSLYSSSLLIDESIYPGSNTGNDMVFNPTSRTVAGSIRSRKSAMIGSVLGGQHMIYVSNTLYDSCEVVKDALLRGETHPSDPFGVDFDKYYDDYIYREHLISWSTIASVNKDLAGAYGNIPLTDVTFKLRVQKPYDVALGTGENNTYPKYEFSLDSFATEKGVLSVAESALDLIRVVPNPYYAYSDYEKIELDNTIKITNLPAKCKVRIYALDGRFIKELSQDFLYPNEVKNGEARLNGNVEEQVVTSLEWDVKNYAGVPAAAGVYLIHVNVEGVGERVLKSFIINRAFDAQRL